MVTKMYRILILLSFAFLNIFALPKPDNNDQLLKIDSTDVPLDLAVPLRITPDTSSGKLKFILNWDKPDEILKYKIFKKLKDDVKFDSPIKTILDTFQTTYIDADVELGQEYDYGVECYGKRYSAYGYISAGYKISPKHSKGKILVLVDDSINSYIYQELITFKNDLIGDGWIPILKTAPRTTEYNKNAVMQTKQIILDEYNKDTLLKALFLLGRIAVPYSGHMAIDGHSPDHFGAWPSDNYYAELNGIWTDTSYIDTVAYDSRNHNYPGDGKFDHNMIPSNIDLQAGRVDFYKLPAFSESEVELYKRYLNKDHLWRNGKLLMVNAGTIVNKFPVYELNESFSANGWQNLSSLVGFDKIYTADDRSVIQSNNSLWYWATGPGAYTSSWTCLYTDELATTPHNAVFTILFGSYNGDWDSEDNVLRAALASKPSILTCVWAGRPFWQFIHMGLGENIGYSTIISQNNRSDYYTSTAKYGSRGTHISLHGDPTLKMHILPPVDTLFCTKNNDNVQINWRYSNFTEIEGYYIYRAASLDEPFMLISEIPVKDTFFIDNNPNFGENYYMVRTTRLENTLSGSYYNLGMGKYDNIEFYPEIPNRDLSLRAYPNPVINNMNILVYSKELAQVAIEVFDVSGKKVTDLYNGNIASGWTLLPETYYFNKTNIATGTYFINVKSKDDKFSFPIVITR